MDSDLAKQIQQTDSDDIGKLNKRLLPSKAFYFFFFSALGSIFPYIGLYFKQLRLSSQQTGVLVGLRPFVQCISVPVWGIVVDRVNIRKISLLVGTVGWLLTYTTIIFVSAGETKPNNCGFQSQLMETKLNSSISGKANISTDIKGSWSGDLSSNFSDRKNRTENKPHSIRLSEIQDSFKKPIFSNIPLQSENHTKMRKNGTPSVKNFREKGTNLFLNLLLVIALGNFVSAPAQTMANLATLQALCKETYKYGQQRLFGSVGWGLTAFIVGVAVSLSATSECTKHIKINYQPCFYLFGIMMAFAFIAATFIKLTEDGESQNGNLLNKPRKQIDFTTLFLLVTAIYCGFALGLIETFLFWHLHDLGGTQLLFSLITGINSLAEMIGFFFSQHLIERFGHLNVIVIGLSSSTAQMLCYGLAKNPWIVLSVEVLKSLAVSCTWAALVSYIGIRPGTVATLQSILHSLYWGFGYAAGGVIGGVFVHNFGAANTFLAMTAVSGLDAFLLVLIINKEVIFEHRNYQALQETSDMDTE